MPLYGYREAADNVVQRDFGDEGVQCFLCARCEKYERTSSIEVRDVRNNNTRVRRMGFNSCRFSKIFSLNLPEMAIKLDSCPFFKLKHFFVSVVLHSARLSGFG